MKSGHFQPLVSRRFTAMVGLVAANIRTIRTPLPYTGMGVRYAGVREMRMAGKTGKK